ncbi:MAG: hypothetical protein WC373_04955 [Smithella sp.]
MDLTTVILNSNEFAESVTIKPLNGTSKTVNAVVFRGEIEPYDMSQGRSLTKTCHVTIAKDGTMGAGSINKGNDKISFPAMEGGTAIDWRIVDVTAEDFASFTLLVRF